MPALQPACAARKPARTLPVRTSAAPRGSPPRLWRGRVLRVPCVELTFFGAGREAARGGGGTVGELVCLDPALPAAGMGCAAPVHPARPASVKPQKTQSNRKNAVEHAGDARSQTKRTPNLRRKKRQIAVDSSEILQNWTAILRFVENSTEILLSGQ
eukprot:scaffold3966_cov126-Isochrysis_galbana.AAC.6